MARTPTIPPVSSWFEVALTRNVQGHVTNVTIKPSQALYQFLSGERGFSTNVNSGANQAKADAAVAQSTANAAAQSAQDAQTNSFAVTVDKAYVLASSDAVEPLTTDAATVTPSGGTGPYTYAWTKVSGDTLTINSPTAATTTFTGTPAYNSNLSGVYRCTVTDSLAATASITVSATVFHVPRVVLDF